MVFLKTLPALSPFNLVENVTKMKIKKNSMICRFILAASTLVLASGYSFADTIISANGALQGVGGTSGLAGTFYSASHNSTNYRIQDTLNVLNASTPDGRFTSSSINYAGVDGSSITQFLGADAGSYTAVTSATSMSDGILEMKGFIQIASPSTIQFSLIQDDSAQLKIGNQVLISANCCGINNAVASFSKAGFYAIDVVYSNTYYYGVGGANVNLSANGNTITNSFYQNVSAVPEPESYAMLLAGLGLTGFMIRRRKTS